MARGDLIVPSAARDDTQDSFNESVAGFGLVVEGPDQVKLDEFYLWPENVATFNLWGEIQTQWRISDGQRTGLIYEGVMICLNLCPAIRKRERTEVFRLLQAMECASLNEWLSKQ
ncbi:MAG: DUF1799 domain-containing protein [Pseudomonadota bacterium]|nr:DUF1799 domain-containing protein [Pseudomonadota bacterium]